METIDITGINIDDLDLCDYKLCDIGVSEDFFSWETCDKCGLRKYIFYNDLLIYSFEIKYKDYIIYFPFNKISIRNENEFIMSFFTEETDIKELIKKAKRIIDSFIFL